MEKALDTVKIEAEISKLMAETVKLNAEAAKMMRERSWYPIVVMSTAVIATATVTKIFFS